MSVIGVLVWGPGMKASAGRSEEPGEPMVVKPGLPVPQAGELSFSPFVNSSKIKISILRTFDNWDFVGCWS